MKDNPKLKSLDYDLIDIFKNWFNPGFLKLRKITWDTKAAILEKLLKYEKVHSMKDMPAVDHDHLEVICFMKRLDNSDVLISNSGKTLDELESGSTVGTSSIRRRAQLLSYRKDLRIKLLRGNVDTRLRKLKDNEYDAIILSLAGLQRINAEHLVTEVLSFDYFLPASCQGAVSLQVKKNNNLDFWIVKKSEHKAAPKNADFSDYKRPKKGTKAYNDFKNNEGKPSNKKKSSKKKSGKKKSGKKNYIYLLKNLKLRRPR